MGACKWDQRCILRPTCTLVTLALAHNIFEIDCIEHKGCMSKYNTFEKNEFLTSNACEKYKIAKESEEFSAAEDLIFRKRGASEYFLKVSFVTIQLLLLHFHYFHQSNFNSHYNIYASSYGSFRIRISLVIKDIGKIFSAAEVIFCACDGIFRRRSTRL